MNKNQRIGVGAAITLVILALGLAQTVWRTSSPDASKKGAVLPKMPGFELITDKKSLVSSASLANQPLFVHFWASWCPPCVEELPGVLELAKAMEGKPIRFVLISTDPQWEDARTLLPKELTSNTISLLDPQAKTAEAFGTYQFPETYLINRKGEILSKAVGPQNWKSEDIKKTLSAL